MSRVSIFGISPTVAALIIAIGPTPHDGLSAGSRLPRENLLVYRTDAGIATPARTIADWLKRRAEIVAGMIAVMGAMPGPEKRVALDMKVEEEVDRGSYVM